tara:strand:+ start:516 stop:1487 length:972 start_codon:yes stop_codon:yes gene_type:complete
MKNWDVIGAPFSQGQSSCSNKKPKMFSWDGVELDVEIWIDAYIEQGLITPKRRGKKYAWICESRSIVPFLSNLYSFNDDGTMRVNGITPVLHDMLEKFDAIFTCDKDLVNLHDKIHFCYAGSILPWIHGRDKGMHGKSLFCSMISSNKVMCHGHKVRHEVFHRIKDEFGEPSEDNPNPAVTIFGGITGEPFGMESGCHLDNNIPWHNKIDGIQDFYYSIIMENDRYPGYFTEKLTDCFATATVPIYWGAPDIGDYFDINGIIQVNSVQEIIDVLRNLNETQNASRDYMSRMDAIKHNFHKVGFLESPDDMLYRKILNMESPLA